MGKCDASSHLSRCMVNVFVDGYQACNATYVQSVIMWKKQHMCEHYTIDPVIAYIKAGYWGSAGHCLSLLICRAVSLTFDIVTECVVITYTIDVFCCWQLSGEWELLPERCAWGSYSCLCRWFLFKGVQIFKVEYEVNSLCYMVRIQLENSLCMQSSFVVNYCI